MIDDRDRRCRRTMTAAVDDGSAPSASLAPPLGECMFKHMFSLILTSILLEVDALSMQMAGMSPAPLLLNVYILAPRPMVVPSCHAPKHNYDDCYHYSRR